MRATLFCAAKMSVSSHAHEYLVIPKLSLRKHAIGLRQFRLKVSTLLANALQALHFIA